MGLPPPFWAFAWAGGQALARYLIDNPALVRGKRALDFASGSGLVAIAAALAGAAEARGLRHRPVRHRRDRGQRGRERRRGRGPARGPDRRRRGLGRRSGGRRRLRKGHGRGRRPTGSPRSPGAARPFWSAIRAAAYLALDRLESVDRISRAGDARTGRFRDQADRRVPVPLRPAGAGRQGPGADAAPARPSVPFFRWNGRPRTARRGPIDCPGSDRYEPA